MNVSVPNYFTGSAGFTISVSGAPGTTAEVIVTGEGCSVRLTISLDANGDGSAFLRARCLGDFLFVLVRDNAGNVRNTATAAI